ncbi:putative TolA protein [Oceaniovalibus guishaninsula JLT2003]|uniref:Putative TolA protein n=1 Tax=Oceaniovalibus guishaninsula JLT2003 TaxID=1231392 RepID=K2HA93_9RHOB|nr:hypothetical protein [Oceaniovalibus guishaninsula]EKE44448.1 putative TolA protein [Oceaniovalibus guishaninsula JLT2003]
MNPGTVISGLGHLLLIAFVLFGGLFTRASMPPPQVAQVTILSETEFAALTRPVEGEQTPPMTDPVAPVPPVEMPDTPEPPAEQAPPVEQAPPPRPEAEAEPPQDVPTPPDPLPAETELPETPEPMANPDTAEDLPVAPVAIPRPADRVSSEPTPPAPPEAETAPDIVETTAPEPDAAAPEAVADTPAAPEETTTEIVTEAEEPARAEDGPRAPVVSQRPRPKPAPPVRQAAVQPETPEAPVTPAQTTEAASENVRDAVQDALAGLEEAAPTIGPAAGPPLSAGEKDAMRVAVQRCWVVDVGSEAAGVTVTVGFEMTPDGRVVGSSLRELDNDGAGAAAKTAYEAARRAILRCQDDGYDLPVDKYEHWRNVEIVFNPGNMRLR